MPPHDGPGWLPLNQRSACTESHGRLLGALLTTFEPPDPEVLIEEYLPAWLGLENSYTNECNGRLRYFAELEDELRRLKGRFAIVSSAGENAKSANGWIWSYVRRFETGAKGRAVQHAKLWMFHRAGAAKGDPESLEIAISSANLTRDALGGQIQAVWRCILPLKARSAAKRKKAWGVLPRFLTELGRSGGDGGETFLAKWADLLGRSDCPRGVTFLASVPGTHQRRCAWGAAGLRKWWRNPERRKLAVMAPVIGSWSSKSVEEWTKFIGIQPGRMSVAWVRAGHPWASRWQLDSPAHKALTQSGVKFLEVPQPTESGDWESPFSEEHKAADHRWSHAKLYELTDGRRRRLLITSANLSRSAWGDPKGRTLSINNFELGVLIDAQEGFSSRLLDREFEPATCDPDREPPPDPDIAWLAADWDGKNLNVECRVANGAKLRPKAVITIAPAGAARTRNTAWRRSQGLFRAKIPWPLRDDVPILVEVSTTNGHTRHAAVADLRKPGDGGRFLCPEADAELLEAETIRLLEERYGYGPVNGSGGAPRRTGKGAARVSDRADYSVPAYEDARRRFRLIDNWRHKLSLAANGDELLIREDGERLLQAWRAQAQSTADPGIRLAAKVAADELSWRLGRSN